MSINGIVTRLEIHARTRPDECWIKLEGIDGNPPGQDRLRVQGGEQAAPWFIGERIWCDCDCLMLGGIIIGELFDLDKCVLHSGTIRGILAKERKEK